MITISLCRILLKILKERLRISVCLRPDTNYNVMYHLELSKKSLIISAVETMPAILLFSRIGTA